MDYRKNEYEDSYQFVLEQQQKIVNAFKNGVNLKQVIKDRETSVIPYLKLFFTNSNVSSVISQAF